jgi:hypothetical protein
VAVKAEASAGSKHRPGAPSSTSGRWRAPLSSRDYNQLASCHPAYCFCRAAYIGFKGVFSVSRNRATQNAFILDSVDNVSYASSYRSMNMQIMTFVDALRNSVRTNGYAAEGPKLRAIISAVVKSRQTSSTAPA